MRFELRIVATVELRVGRGLGLRGGPRTDLHPPLAKSFLPCHTRVDHHHRPQPYAFDALFDVHAALGDRRRE
eukprot:scaffold4146_cov63-Phaeocystis_antarctica.AAC.12